MPDTVYPLLLTIPDPFLDDRPNTPANHGLTALTAFLERVLSVEGFQATVAWGGLGHDVVVMVRKRHA